MTLRDLKSISPLLHHRVSAMVDDGFQLVVCARVMKNIYVKVVHRTNGHRVSLVFHADTHVLQQFSNDKLVYDGIVQG